jgi:hypothetical protein
LQPLARLRRIRKERRHEAIARIIELTDPEAASRWRDALSDAGLYFDKLASTTERVSDALRTAAEIDAAIERDGIWEGGHEWRISTTRADRIEKKEDAYVVSTTCDGVYAARVPSLATALEALQVLTGFQADLFYEVGWASSASGAEHEVRKPYLARVSHEALRADPETVLGTTIRETTVDWLEQPGYEVVVESGGLSMTCVSPTLERARQFAGIFRTVQADILRLLAWN